MNTLTFIKDAVVHLFYPHICAGCGTDALPVESSICIKCIHELPLTGFENYANSPVEKALAGRINIKKATAQLFFTKQSALQNLMYQFKYRGNKDLGYQLGLMMGNQLLESKRFGDIDALIPLPLHEKKMAKRGYNQAEILCNGIAEILQIPVINDAITRTHATETQTKRHRVERWQNMEGKFTLITPDKIENKNVLLVDDVITTGATIEACASALLNVNGLGLNIASLCYRSLV